ncbi:hypothetical protein GWI33_005965 [Rhynchophorus ferrugineus]|uniref:Uncharacterized protein n=1 Tax=Rhynchophorus ferrugineus TaxID=354439 RepID=A0A834IXU9_RHYFE|nr:hypothetical protein GWI33_005965 [Rhynchophorus ferrugineus]
MTQFVKYDELNLDGRRISYENNGMFQVQAKSSQNQPICLIRETSHAKDKRLAIIEKKNYDNPHLLAFEMFPPPSCCFLPLFREEKFLLAAARDLTGLTDFEVVRGRVRNIDTRGFSLTSIICGDF